jgi:hypothetical protein
MHAPFGVRVRKQRSLPSQGLAVLALSALPAAQLGLHQTLTPADGRSADWFGNALSLDGERLLIGAPNASGPQFGSSIGAAYLYERAADGWHERQVLPAPLGPTQFQFGTAVALDGPVAAIGAPHLGPPAAAPYVAVYSDSPTGFQLDALLQPSSGPAESAFGWTVDVDGERVLVGAPLGERAYIFQHSGGAWVEQAELVPSDAAPGQFGRSVALDGTRALVGAPYSDGPTSSNAGAVYVFEFEAGAWVQKEKWQSPTPESERGYGQAVALDGDSAIVSENASGVVRGYARSEGQWIHQHIFGNGAGDTLAGVQNAQLDLRGERALIGRHLHERFYGQWTCLGALNDATLAVQPPYLPPAAALDGEQAVLGALNGGANGVAHVFDSLDSTSLVVAVSAPLPSSFGAAQSVAIGALSARTNSSNRIELRFALQSSHADLDDCHDFRWVTVQLSATADGVPQTNDAEFGLLPALTESASANAQPFRYTAAEWAAGVSAGTAIRKEGQYSLYFDEPWLPATPAVVRRYHTFLVAHDVASNDLGAHTLGILAGIAWQHDSATNMSRVCGPIESGNALIAQAIWDGIQGCPGSAGCPGFASWGAPHLVLLAPCAVFDAEPDHLSLTSGGASLLRVNASAAHAGEFYLVLGSLGGTSPGLEFGPHVVGLNPDTYFGYTLSAPNQPPLANSLGLLSAGGKAVSTFTLPALADPTLAGLVVAHAVIVLDAALAVSVVGSPATITLLP